MKKVLSCVFALLFLCMLIPKAKAETAEIEYLPDGSYFVTTIAADESDACRGNITRIKESIYYDASGVEQWRMKLTASFFYNGTTSYCTSCSVTYTIQNTAWHFDGKQENIDGNVAFGSLTMVKKFLGITIKTVTRSLTLTCDKDGNVS